MKMPVIDTLLAAPLSSLFLLLMPFLSLGTPSTSGYWTYGSNWSDTCVDGRLWVVELRSDGKNLFNGKAMEESAIQQKLKAVLQPLPEQVLYLDAATELPYQRVASFLGEFKFHNPHAYIVWINRTSHSKEQICLTPAITPNGPA